MSPYNVTHDGHAHMATVKATSGVGTVDLSTTTRMNAATYFDTWTFHDAGGNYQDASGTVTDTIAKTTLS